MALTESPHEAEVRAEARAWLDDNFPAAQFFDLNQDDLLAKPSFERYDAGFEVGQRQYLFGATEADIYDYEEVNLSTPTVGSVLSAAALSELGHLGWSRSASAAGRSDLRRGAKLRPEVERKIVVNPPPLATLDVGAGTMKGTALNGTAAGSFWAANDVAQASGAKLQVVESFETALSF